MAIKWTEIDKEKLKKILNRTVIRWSSVLPEIEFIISDSLAEYREKS